MAFNPDTSPTFQKFLASRASFNAEGERDYELHLIAYLCSQADATGTINAAMVANADTNAKAAVKQKKITY
jgi:hypothetical protein